MLNWPAVGLATSRSGRPVWLALRDRAGLGVPLRLQSSLFGWDLSAESVAKVSADHAGALSGEGEVARAVLEGLARGATLGVVAGELMEGFPGRFAGTGEALAQVTRISLKYGR